MNHPTREEWMSYLYDESPREAGSALRSHLEACAECRREVETWTGAARRLDDWPLPRRRAGHRFAMPMLKWAAAAAVLALAVLGGTRLWALSSEVTSLRADVHGAVKREVESNLRLAVTEQVQRHLDAAVTQFAAESGKAAGAEAQVLIAAFVKSYEEKRLQEQQAMLAALQQLQSRLATDYAGLRKELETVAVFAEAGLQRTQSQIANIAYLPNTTINQE
jgi:hypothetical protein